MKIYLSVEFREKDRVKALGARWDALERRWYVPEGLDPVSFSSWLPAEVTGGAMATTEDALLAPAVDTALAAPRGQRLLELLLRVQRGVSEAVPNAEWVRVEVGNLRTQGDHLWLELVDHSDQGQLLARITGVIWGSQRPLVERFCREAATPLATGLKLLILAKPEYHALYGASLRISDIDPAYTVGEMALKLQAIRESLKRSGAYDLNRALPFPTDYVHVAVISPAQAAGLGDFRAEADRLERHGLCRFSYYPAVFQGETAPREVLTALAQALLAASVDPVDAVVVIRGGGATTDLMWLNDEQLALALCHCPIPVITGIGHERDNTILDEIAGRRCDTPSKVAQLITQSIVEGAQEAQRALDTLTHLALERLNQVEQGSNRWEQGVRRDAERRLHLVAQGVERQGSEVREKAATRLALLDQQIDAYRQQVEERSWGWLREVWQQLRYRIETILGAGPDKALARGYGVVRVDQRVVTRTSQIAPGVDFNLEMQDGRLDARRTDP